MGDVGPQKNVISNALMRSRQNVEHVMSFGKESAIAFTNAPEITATQHPYSRI